jgi:hypothetical protein
MPQVGFLFPGPDARQPPTAITMPTTSPTTALRINPENANHHLWNNHGTWFLHYTVHPTPFTKERIRRTLGTRDVRVARERRDAFLAHLVQHSDPVAA